MGIVGRCPMKVLHTQGVMNTRPALVGSKGVSTGVALRQRVQQGLRLLEICRVKALGEPAVDWCQERVDLSALALVLPQPRQAHGRAQLQGFGLLVAGNSKGFVKTSFSLNLILCRTCKQ